MVLPNVGAVRQNPEVVVTGAGFGGLGVALSLHRTGFDRMQSLDNSLTTTWKSGRMTTRQGEGAPNPSWIPARRLADRTGGVARGAWTHLADVPLTGHLIGGCVIGDSPATGVVDPYHRMHGRPGLHVVNRSAIPANLGVNPALTITALAERAMSLWPNKGEPYPRPPIGEPYARLRAVAPRRPAVPAHAPAALRVTDAL